MSSRALFGRICLAALAAGIAAAPAAAALDLSTYTVSLQRGIEFDEASGVAYNYDKNVLFVVDDEGDDAAEFSLTGQKLTADRFQSNYRDVEGVTYVGGGRYVIANERTEEMIRIQAIGTDTTGALPRTVYSGPDTARIYQVNGGANVGNNGLEGVAYDPTTGGYFGVRQGGLPTVSEQVYLATINFDATPVTGTTTRPFDPAPLGLATLSDIAVLAANPNFAGTDYYQNLLILSLGSQKLIEVTRTGQQLSSFDLSGLQIHDIEGVVVGHDGKIYLVGETGGTTPGSASTSGLVVLSRNVAAVPEPASWAMMIGGFGLVGAAMRRRPRIAATAA